MDLIRQFLRGGHRVSRFHDEKGNFVDLASLPNSIPAFLSAVTLGLFDQAYPAPPPVNDENAMSTPARM